jgi:hypothetical protein
MLTENGTLTLGKSSPLKNMKSMNSWQMMMNSTKQMSLLQKKLIGTS